MSRISCDLDLGIGFTLLCGSGWDLMSDMCSVLLDSLCFKMFGVGITCGYC